MNLPILESRRLLLRPIEASDIDFIYELNRHPEVIKYVFNEPHTYEQAQADLGRYLNFPLKYNMPIGVWVGTRLNSDEPLGIYFLKKLAETGEFEIGYRIAFQHWNNGYATEGSKRILEYALNDLEIERVIGVTHPKNISSSHVLQKLGLLYEKNETFYGVNCKYYGLTLGEAYFL